MWEADEFLEYIDIVEEELLHERQARLPKRYIRDAEDPLQVFRDEEFRRRYRFSKHTVVNTLLPLVAPGLQKNNNRGLPVAPITQLLVSLRFYATSNFQAVSGDLRGLSQPTISIIIRRVSILLAQRLGEFIHFPQTNNAYRSNIQSFYNVANFPNVSGCIDCSHIRISNPGGANGEVFRNRKGYFSLNVQVVAGPNREILDIVVRHPGSRHDSVIFDRSSLRVRLERGDIPGVLLGDNGYACRHYLLTPLLQPATPSELRYNTAHIRTRNIVERLFGTWKKRFPCLYRGLQTRLDTSVAIICATAVLYNIGLQEHEELEDVADEEIQEVLVNRIVQDAAARGLEFRRHFIETHFTN